MKPTLPAEVAEKYELVGWTGGPVQNFGKHGDIDIQKITLAHADVLYRRGFNKLKLREKPTAKSSPTALAPEVK